MSRYFSQQEENFWPCVSDMFLALFIIALALFSLEKNRGKNADILQEELMADETCRLIETLSDAFPDDECISSLKQNTERIRDQHDNKDDPCKGGEDCEMNRALTQLPQSVSVQRLLGHQQPNSGVKFDNKKDYHSKAVGYFLQFVIPEEERRSTSDSDSDGARLSHAHQEILRCIIEQTKDKIKVLTNTVDKDRAELLKMLAEARADVKRKDERIEQLRRDIDVLREKYEAELSKKNWGIASMTQKIKEKDEQIAKLKERLGEDMRPRIMDNLKEIMNSTGCNGLVEIDREAGVLRIPSDTLTFNTRNQATDLNNPFANSTSEENLKKIAVALKLFMEEDSKEHLVDTIIIEGHADPYVRGGPIFEYANDEASAWRALGTWLALNRVYSDKFANYKNKRGKAIFGIAGYGSRNRLERKLYESDDHYNKRCRRIDIRFIPAPKSDL